MKDLIHLPDVVSTYSGGTGGELGIDNNFNSAHAGTCGRSQGVTITSQHIFPDQYTMMKIVFKFYVFAMVQNDEPYNKEASASHQIYVYVGGNWIEVPAATFSGNVPASGTVEQSTEATLFVSYQNCTGIKAVCSSSNSIAGGSGTGSGTVKIFEIQAYGQAKVKNTQIV